MPELIFLGIIGAYSLHFEICEKYLGNQLFQIITKSPLKIYAGCLSSNGEPLWWPGKMQLLFTNASSFEKYWSELKNLRLNEIF